MAEQTALHVAHRLASAVSRLSDPNKTLRDHATHEYSRFPHNVDVPTQDGLRTLALDTGTPPSIRSAAIGLRLRLGDEINELLPVEQRQDDVELWQVPWPFGFDQLVRASLLSNSFTPYFWEHAIDAPYSRRADIRYMIEAAVITATNMPVSPTEASLHDAHIVDIEAFVTALTEADAQYASIRNAGYQDCQFLAFHIGAGGDAMLNASLKCRCIALYLGAESGLDRSTADQIAAEHGFALLGQSVLDAQVPGYFSEDRPVTMQDFVFEVD